MKRVVAIIMLMFSVAIVFVGCNKVSSFSEEEHIQRISERIEKRYQRKHSGDVKQKDFKLYPLYGKNEELKMFLVEYDPDGFTFILLQDEPFFLASCLQAHKSMYIESACRYNKSHPWSPYIADENGIKLSDLIYGMSSDYRGTPIFDENGEVIYYGRSPYYVSGNIDEKKYILETEDTSEYICAVKQDGKFINLISMTALPDAESYDSSENACISIILIASRMFDL